jgi:hypothetical protein
VSPYRHSIREAARQMSISDTTGRDATRGMSTTV